MDEAYALLIDVYRMRVEDEYMYSGEAGGLYMGEGVGGALEDFERFLDTATEKRALPPWWDHEIDDEAITAAALDTTSWPSIAHAMEKSDVNEHYGNSFAAMTLRVRAALCCDS